MPRQKSGWRFVWDLASQLHLCCRFLVYAGGTRHLLRRHGVYGIDEVSGESMGSAASPCACVASFSRAFAKALPQGPSRSMRLLCFLDAARLHRRSASRNSRLLVHPDITAFMNCRCSTVSAVSCDCRSRGTPANAITIKIHFVLASFSKDARL